MNDASIECIGLQEYRIAVRVGVLFLQEKAVQLATVLETAMDDRFDNDNFTHHR